MNKYLIYLIQVVLILITTSSFAEIDCPTGQHIEKVESDGGMFGVIVIDKCVVDEEPYKELECPTGQHVEQVESDGGMFGVIVIDKCVVDEEPYKELECPTGQHYGQTGSQRSPLSGATIPTYGCIPDEQDSEASSTEDETYTEGIEAGKEKCKKDPESCGIDNSKVINTAKEDAKNECKKDPESCGIDNSKVIDTAKVNAQEECKKDPESCGIDDSEIIKTAKEDAKDECKKDPESCGIDNSEAIKTAKEECTQNPIECGIEIPVFDGNTGSLYIPRVNAGDDAKYTAKLEQLPGSNPIQFVLVELGKDGLIINSEIKDVVTSYNFSCDLSETTLLINKRAISDNLAEYQFTVTRKPGSLVAHKLITPYPFTSVIYHETETFESKQIFYRLRGKEQFIAPQYSGWMKLTTDTLNYIFGFAPVIGTMLSTADYINETNGDPKAPVLNQTMLNHMGNINDYEQSLIILKNDPDQDFVAIRMEAIITEKYRKPIFYIQWINGSDNSGTIRDIAIAELYHEDDPPFTPYVLLNDKGNRTKCTPE